MEEKVLMTFEKVDYIDEDRLSVIFLSLVINVESVNKYYEGGMKRFIQHDLVYGVTNGRIFIMSEMYGVPHHLDEVMGKLLEPCGMQYGPDFVFGLDERCEDFNRGKPLEWCKTGWLESSIENNGNFVWYRNKKNENHESN